MKVTWFIVFIFLCSNVFAESTFFDTGESLILGGGSTNSKIVSDSIENPPSSSNGGGSGGSGGGIVTTRASEPSEGETIAVDEVSAAEVNNTTTQESSRAEVLPENEVSEEKIVPLSISRFQLASLFFSLIIFLSLILFQLRKRWQHAPPNFRKK